jgi:hypothetical protein
MAWDECKAGSAKRQEYCPELSFKACFFCPWKRVAGWEDRAVWWPDTCLTLPIPREPVFSCAGDVDQVSAPVHVYSGSRRASHHYPATRYTIAASLLLCWTRCSTEAHLDAQCACANVLRCGGRPLVATGCDITARGPRACCCTGRRGNRTRVIEDDR